MRMLHVGILAATRLPVILDYGDRRMLEEEEGGRVDEQKEEGRQ